VQDAVDVNSRALLVIYLSYGIVSTVVKTVAFVYVNNSGYKFLITCVGLLLYHFLKYIALCSGFL